MIPGLRAGREKIHGRFEAAWIVEASRGDQNELRKSGCLRENSAAAVRTKSTAECIAAVGAALAATNKSTLLLPHKQKRRLDL